MPLARSTRQRNDRKAERDGDAELEAYNEMLAKKADEAHQRGEP